ncbi:hypothetical protein JX265_013822 [Neoarthrinium moseri]|uniref:Uncharacterized protein n=1 Tax=Neoarthrinium moseri TaxID=1658444 RepID=A0A9P9W7W9_9PEZI|nr:hypothetical protein JX265_013822 [Neoarthrinium moseri]
MGHVVVEASTVDKLIERAQSEAVANPEAFARSRLGFLVHGDDSRINARFLGLAANENDEFALQLLDEMQVPFCPCGNVTDLCSYSSGRAVLKRAQKLSAQCAYSVRRHDITDEWLQAAIVEGHPLTRKVLHDSVSPLALRILQSAADLGLENSSSWVGSP